MGLSISYLKGAMAATVARWTESLQLLNKVLQKEYKYNHDAMIDEPREVSKLNKALILTPHPLKLVHDAPREFVVDVCDVPREYLEDKFDVNYPLNYKLDYNLEMIRKLRVRIAETAKKQEEFMHNSRLLAARMAEDPEFCEMINKHTEDFVLSTFSKFIQDGKCVDLADTSV